MPIRNLTILELNAAVQGIRDLVNDPNQEQAFAAGLADVVADKWKTNLLREKLQQVFAVNDILIEALRKGTTE